MDSLHIERRELKYFVPEERTEEIRRFIQPYVVADPHAAGLPGGRYTIHNVYLDTPRMDFYRACLVGALDRVKLRIRWYDDEARGPFFLEVKRKIRDVVVKDRVYATRDEALTVLRGGVPAAANTVDRGNWAGFLGRMSSTGATPRVIVRYTREPYESVFGEYARLTFDREIGFQEAPRDGFAEDPRAWTYGDAAWATKGMRTATVLELKTTDEVAPRWMQDLVTEFGLERTGYSKYATSIGGLVGDGRASFDVQRHSLAGRR